MTDATIVLPAPKLLRVLEYLVCEPWLLTPEMHATLTGIVRSHAFGGAAEDAQHRAAADYPANPKKRGFAVIGDTAVLPVEGVIGRKFSDSLYSSGVTSVDVLHRMLNAAAGDPQVNSILLAFDSPGGIVTGVPEAAAAVASARARKPIVAYADGQMCSAAYWIAAQADVVYAMPSAQVGSIGVYLALLDQSRAAEMQGLRVEMFRSGKHKGMGQPGTTLTDEQRAMMQTRVDAIGAQFRAAVQDGRGRPIAADIMQGQSFGAAEAKAAGLIDSVTDFDTALADAVRLAKMRR
jgi:signal peptide peptidase SppA